MRDEVAFSYIKRIYSKPLRLYDEDDELRDIQSEYRVYKAVKERGQPPILIYDQDGYVNPRKLNYSLVKVSLATLQQLAHDLSPNLWKRFNLDYGLTQSEDSGFTNIEALHKLGVVTTPVPQLKDLSFLRQMNWHEFVEDIINFKKKEMDPRLKQIRKCILPRGIMQGVNPHSIIVLPGQTGKSDWFDCIGRCEDKVNANGLIGYADTEGPHPGSADGSELPYALDQIESSGMYRIFRYFLSLLESGRAKVTQAGGDTFIISCSSTFAILSNPLGDPKSSFALIINHMSKNPALGRRFGIILYDKEAVKLKTREKDLDQLREKVRRFRAVEEAALTEIKKIIDEEKVWTWLNERNEEVVAQGLKLIEPLATEEDENLYLFLKEFIENGTTHTRGGALYGAMAVNLDKIALKEYDLDELLAEAEDNLHELLEINFVSLQKITQSYEQTKEEGALRTFDMLPTYLKEVVSAVELYRRSLAPEQATAITVPMKLPLATLDYTPKTQFYFSKVLYEVLRGNPERHNERLKEHFDFELMKENGTVAAVLHSTRSIPFLKVFGVFGRFGDFGSLGGEEKRRLDTSPKPSEKYETHEIPKADTQHKPALGDLLPKLRTELGSGGWTETKFIGLCVKHSYPQEEAKALFDKLADDGEIGMDPKGLWRWV